MLTVSSLWLFA